MNSNGTVIEFIHAMRACAMQMLSDAQYILRELPGIGVPRNLRPTIESVCQKLISAKHDVITETFELAELVEKETAETKLHETM